MAVSRSAVEVGVIGAVGEFLIFNHFLPPVLDVRANEPYNSEIEKAERTALIVGTAFLLLLTAFTRRSETFAIVGGALVGVDFAYKHANAVHPASGTMQRDQAEQTMYSLPDFDDDAAAGAA